VTGDFDVFVKGTLVWSKKGGDGDCNKSTVNAIVAKV
jgi:hypothetical protein